mmetsp:Transcript_33591/g.72845  ORF Transcript_33591/g.72845 Transcript_33591/m.72845 type:complete len:223 (+) Transcript_33591:480-1148(+)
MVGIPLHPRAHLPRCHALTTPAVPSLCSRWCSSGPTRLRWLCEQSEPHRRLQRAQPRRLRLCSINNSSSSRAPRLGVCRTLRCKPSRPLSSHQGPFLPNPKAPRPLCSFSPVVASESFGRRLQGLHALLFAQLHPLRLKGLHPREPCWLLPMAHRVSRLPLCRCLHDQLKQSLLRGPQSGLRRQRASQEAALLSLRPRPPSSSEPHIPINSSSNSSSSREQH